MAWHTCISYGEMLLFNPSIRSDPPLATQRLIYQCLSFFFSGLESLDSGTTARFAWSSSHFQAEMGLSWVARVLEMGQRDYTSSFCAFVRHACNIIQHMCELICLLKVEGGSDIIRA